MEVTRLEYNKDLNKDIESINTKLFNRHKPFNLLVTAKWCGHCTHLTHGKQSPWNKFKKKMQDKDVHIVECDYDAMVEIGKDKDMKKSLFNKILQKSVNGFPAVMYITPIKDNNIDVVMYDGAYPISTETLLTFQSSIHN